MTTEKKLQLFYELIEELKTESGKMDGHYAEGYHKGVCYLHDMLLKVFPELKEKEAQHA